MSHPQIPRSPDLHIPKYSHLHRHRPRPQGKGKGPTQDLDRAAEWMRKAVRHTSPEDDAQKARNWLAARGLEP